MKKSVLTIALIIGISLSPSVVGNFQVGADTLMPYLNWYTYDSEKGIITYDLIIEDGGTYYVPLNSGKNVSFGFHDSGNNAWGILYFIDPEMPERELVEYGTDQSWFTELTWGREGVYELDVYDQGAPQPAYAPLWKNFLASLVSQIVYAEEEEEPYYGEFVGTIKFTILEIQECCSSVLFLPGVKGSVLESDSNTLWPPTALTNDMDQLALDEEGESVNDVRVVGVLDSFYTRPIYSPFSNFMNNLVSENLISGWLPFAYDWRFSPEKIINEGVNMSDKTLYIFDELVRLASNSQTGKVTIVAHSMGGLLGKAAIEKLEENGMDYIVDSFVMVGTPQLGTPQAAAALLHGDGEGIALGAIVNSIRVRQLGQNLPSAHNLLPSRRYFDEVSDPVITFNPKASFTEPWRSFWGVGGINDYNNFELFLTGAGVSRDKPQMNLTRLPEVLRSGLVSGAADFHDKYDNYDIPNHIRVVQVAGWGLPTTKAVNYRTRHLQQSYETVFTREGDGTVVYPSAISSIGEIYFFNLDLSKDSKHHDLLSALSMRVLLRSLIEKEDIEGIDFITNNRPNVTDVDDKLVVSTHSPVVLGAYDGLGNFTGIDPNQDLDSDILLVLEDIPGSSFIVSGGSQYLFLPKEGNYQASYRGTGSGPTTVEIHEFVSDTATPIVSYSDIPTTQSTVAGFVIDSSEPANTTIELDTDGDGETDELLEPDGSDTDSSLAGLIEILKNKVAGLGVKQNIKNNLLKRIDNLEKRIEKKKQQNAKILARLDNQIAKKGAKGKIDAASVEELTTLLDELESQSDGLVFDKETLDEIRDLVSSLNAKANIKNNLLKRLENLEKKQALVKTLSNFVKSIENRGARGKMDEQDVNEIINLINQIESVL